MLLLRDIISYNAAPLPPETSLREAAEMMRMRGASVLPVADSGQMIGLVTDREIALSVAVDQLDPERTPVGMVMAEEVVTVFDDRDLLAAPNLMQYNKVERLAVLDRTTNACLGVITMDEVVARLDPDDLPLDEMIGGVPPSPDVEE